MTSAAEARLDAKVRPEIAAMRASTSYPRRRRPAHPAGTAPGRPLEAITAQVVQLRPVPPTTSDVRASKPAATDRQALPAMRAQGQGPVRLTRRGRIVVGALAVMAGLAVAAVLWLVVAGQAQAASHLSGGGSAGAGHGGLVRVVVRPGQSLWGIAMAADPQADPRVVIHEIIDDNELSGTAVQVGQVLWVPRS